jgi:hypothetical protein
MSTLIINLSRAQREIGALDEAMAVLLNEAVNFLSPHGGLLVSDKPHTPKRVTLSQLAEIEPTLALFCLRWLMIDNVAEYCRQLAWEMVDAALVEHGAVLKDNVLDTLLKGEYSLQSAEHRIVRFEQLKCWSDCYGGSTPDANAFAIDVARASIADLDFDSITDPDQFVLDAPLNVLKAWSDLAIVASAEIQIAGRMMVAAEKAEAQWRSGTKLEFDFSGAEIDTAYWELWQHLRSGIEAETGWEAKRVIASLGHA